VADKTVVYLYQVEKYNYGLFAIDLTFNGKLVLMMNNGFLRVTMEHHEYTAIIFVAFFYTKGESLFSPSAESLKLALAAFLVKEDNNAHGSLMTFRV